MVTGMKTTSSKHIVIFSHGFGVQKDSLGLFTEIGDMLAEQGIEPVLFDYNGINIETKEVCVKPFSEQANILQEVINKTVKENPDATIDIIAHSQGPVMVALANTTGIRKVILLSPFFHTDMQKIMDRYNKYTKSEIDFNGISRRVRKDGTTTIIPASYWAERFATDVYTLYNNLASRTDMTIINAAEDKVIEGGADLMKILNVPIINIHGDHDFSSEFRPKLLEIIRGIIITKVCPS